VQHAVEGVEEEFVFEGDLALARLLSGVGEAEVDFSGKRAAFEVEVEGEGEDVSGGAEVHVAVVELGHCRVADEGEGQFAQGGFEEGMGTAEVVPEVVRAASSGRPTAGS